MSSILYRNNDNDIFVVDIPATIAEAQSFSSARQLASCPPPQRPWLSSEPKSVKAKFNFSKPHSHDVEYQQVLFTVTKYLHDKEIARYHLPRWTGFANGVPCELQRPKSPQLSSPSAQYRVDERQLPQSLNLTRNEQSLYNLGEVTNRLVANNSDETFTLQIGNDANYYIAPKSMFFLGDCNKSRSFHEALWQYARDQNVPNNFHMLLMDPPWPNRSVRRSSSNDETRYEVCESVWHLRQLLFDMDISTLLADDGYVAVWVTNNQAARSLILSTDDGLFSAWNVVLVEEWLWVKLTQYGDPVLPIDGLWRKPYEVLLIGRRCGELMQGRDQRVYSKECERTKKRVIFAVPDLHSRKPCLKDLLQDLLRLPKDTRSLEVFARNLVSGWTSWGNQVLKFNDFRCWRDVQEQTSGVH
ncbi:hypothetical protein KVT40_004286 [Elsinoe batatas]|uniref:MT-A70-domain-containing protein n=1 Tax=Elsinoe batatas TaxID=2601811 RepID=A0A8K0L5A3_9PEZI|nr:hypothetical protein KVT40_004286 [Elsinoe batatas]